MNYKTLNVWQSGFHDWVIRRHPREGRKQNGFMGGFIFGERGTGKSTYCFKLSAKVYSTLNGYDSGDEEEAYREALHYMVFDPMDLRTLLIRNKIKGEITPMLILDDASMHFGNNLHMINPKLYSAIRAETATMRTAVTGLAINAPRRGHVAKCLRDYDDYKGEAMTRAGAENMERENWNRKIRYYRWKWYPDEKKFNIKIPFQDKYSCYIPEPYYSWYTKKKNYFEVKYEIDVADHIDKSTREIFFDLKDKLPEYHNKPNLKSVVSKWEKEHEEKRRQSKIDIINKKLKEENLKKKLEKYKEDMD